MLNLASVASSTGIILARSTHFEHQPQVSRPLVLTATISVSSTVISVLVIVFIGSIASQNAR
jgi:hypothetical protein